MVALLALRQAQYPCRSDTKGDTVNELAEYFRAQARWREQKAKEYPDDERNARSAELLNELADFVTPDKNGQYRHPEIERLLPYVHQDYPALGGKGVAHAVSRIGFDRWTLVLGSLFLVQELLPMCIMDAYEEAVEHGEDWTETLTQIELEAARVGAVLPGSYWYIRAAGLHKDLEVAEIIAAYAGEAR